MTQVARIERVAHTKPDRTMTDDENRKFCKAILAENEQRENPLPLHFNRTNAEYLYIVLGEAVLYCTPKYWRRGYVQLSYESAREGGEEWSTEVPFQREQEHDGADASRYVDMLEGFVSRMDTPENQPLEGILSSTARRLFDAAREAMQEAEEAGAPSDYALLMDAIVREASSRSERYKRQQASRLHQ